MKNVSFSLENTNEYYGRIDGQRFFIGKRVSYEGNKGLANTRGNSILKYNRFNYQPEFGFWADFIHPTSVAEGGFYHALNTYDRAHFTFTFLQYAAHVPNGDLVNYLVYLGEPHASARKELGLTVMAFLLGMLILSYALKREYWKDIH